MASKLLQARGLTFRAAVRGVHHMRLHPTAPPQATPFLRSSSTKPHLKPIVFPKDPRSMRNYVPAPSVLSSLPIFKWLSEEGQEKQRTEVYRERKAKERHEAIMISQQDPCQTDLDPCVAQLDPWAAADFRFYGGQGYEGSVYESEDQADLAERRNGSLGEGGGDRSGDGNAGTDQVGGGAGMNGDIVNGSDFTGIGFDDGGGGGLD